MRAVATLVAVLAAAGCSVPAEEDPQAGFSDGEPADERDDMPDLKSDRPAPYVVPEDLPELVAPEIIVSLEGLTVHLFDRETGVSRVYPVGVGRLGSSGRSITPTGHFTTHSDITNGWFYAPSRWDPAYFEGYPFLRISAVNRNGYNTYGLHGPITHPLHRGYVSHGCMRMDYDDIVELFFMVRGHPATPVTIQQERELDAAGNPVDVGAEVTLWAPGERIAFGASVGPREGVSGFIGDACERDEDCGQYADASDPFCHPAGFCTQPCAGYCPEAPGHASTFCIEDGQGGGVCASKVSPLNHECADVPGSFPDPRSRFVGDSGAAARVEPVCAPAT